MVIYPPLDAVLQVPWSVLIDKLLFDFDMLDLVFWFPRLSWPELGQAFGGMVLCKCASDQIENWALAPLKTRLKARIGRCWPRLGQRLGWAG
jgi:hypothetical protein